MPRVSLPLFAISPALPTSWAFPPLPQCFPPLPRRPHNTSVAYPRCPYSSYALSHPHSQNQSPPSSVIHTSQHRHSTALHKSSHQIRRCIPLLDLSPPSPRMPTHRRDAVYRAENEHAPQSRRLQRGYRVYLTYPAGLSGGIAGGGAALSSTWVRTVVGYICTSVLWDFILTQQ